MGSMGVEETMFRNVVVVGGSYVGTNVAEQLASALPSPYRVLLIEKNSHFQHLFAFPRFAVTTKVDTHKAFIPYNRAKLGPNGAVLQAKVTNLTKSALHLDRPVQLDGNLIKEVPYAYLALTTGTKLSAPSTLPGSEKKAGVAYLREHAEKVQRSKKIVIIGAGAVGVQTATDIKELYPENSVTLVHSRKQMMTAFHPDLSDVVARRCEELGVDLVLGQRVKLPSDGFPTDGREFEVELGDGRKLAANFAIVCTGQVPQSDVLTTLAPDVINERGFVKVRKTLQVDDEALPHVYALGDVADTGAHKAARPAMRQAEVVAQNVVRSIQEKPLEDYEVTGTAAIHMSLGIKQNVIFVNPAGDGPPMVKPRDDGTLDMNIDGVWARRGGGPDAML